MAPLLNMRYEKERYNLKINKSISIFKINTSKVKKEEEDDLNIFRSHVMVR